MKKGFTLIEMLIVIAIIAILSSVFLVGLRGFRSGAYDARRLADLQKVQSYLEIYYTKNRKYPNAGANHHLKDIQSDFLDITLPNDPIGGKEYYYGVDITDYQSYVLGVPISPGHSSYNDPTTITSATYGVGCAKDVIFCIKF